MIICKTKTFNGFFLVHSWIYLLVLSVIFFDSFYTQKIISTRGCSNKSSCSTQTTRTQQIKSTKGYSSKLSCPTQTIRIQQTKSTGGFSKKRNCTTQITIKGLIKNRCKIIYPNGTIVTVRKPDIYDHITPKTTAIKKGRVSSKSTKKGQITPVTTPIKKLSTVTDVEKKVITDTRGHPVHTDVYQKPITDRNGMAVFTDRRGKPITDEYGRALNTDLEGKPIYTDENGKTISVTVTIPILTDIPLVTDTSGQNITDKYGDPIFTDRERQPITDIKGKAVFTDSHGNPITDSDGVAVVTNKDGLPVYTDSKGRPMTDRFKNPVNTDNLGNPITDKKGKAIFTDKYGRLLTNRHRIAVATNPEGHPIYLDPKGQPITDKYGQLAYTDENGKAITDVNGHAVVTDLSGKIVTDSKGRSVSLDVFGRPIYTNSDGKPITDKAGNPVFTDINGKPITNANGLALPTDNAGHGVATDQAGRPIYTNSAGKPITDDSGNPVFTNSRGEVIRDVEGRPVYTDSLGRAVYTYKDGSPITNKDGLHVYTDVDGNPLYRGNTIPMKAESEAIADYDYTEATESPHDYHDEVKKIPIGQMRDAKKSKDCIPKQFSNDSSIVCVCNRTYCDKFPPIEPQPKGSYLWYVSSKEGLRFYETTGKFNSYYNRSEEVFVLDENEQFHKIIGFGGAFSDSACYTLNSLSPETHKQLLESYFGFFGIGYTLGRVPMGGTDFSDRAYTYMDKTEDTSIDGFELADEDHDLKIPIIIRANELSREKLKLIATPWTAPKWMKTVCNITKSGLLKRDYFDLWSQYYVKFLDEYKKRYVKFWAVTTGNEPMFRYYDLNPEGPSINTMGWSPFEQSQWVRNFLKPQLSKNFGDVLIIAYDENRRFAPYYLQWFFSNFNGEKYMNLVYNKYNKAYDYVAGIGFHWYTDTEGNLKYLDWIKDLFPEKFLLYTESCAADVTMGSWDNADKYAINMIMNLNHHVSGWIDWNLVLDMKGGPNWVNNFQGALVNANAERDEFYKQPAFYIMGHFSKFILPNSYRLDIKPKKSNDVYALSFRRPDRACVVIFYNRNDTPKTVTLVRAEHISAVLTLEANSINSLIYW